MHPFAKFLLVGSALLTGCQSLAPVPTESMTVKQLRVNGVDLAYVEEGAGSTVVFVHGASGDWRTWEGVRPYVSPKYRYVSMSRRYHYPNAWTDDGRHYSLEQQVEDVAGFIRALGVGKVHLVGSSYSGRLAGYVAMKYPELLRSVVLGEPSLATPTSAEGKAAAAAFGKDLTRAGETAKAGDDRQSAILVANAVLGDSEGFGKWSPVRQQRWLDNAKTMGPMFAGRPLAPMACDKLATLKVPALVVRGEKTRDSYRYGHEAVLQCLPPTTESAIIAGATHTWGADNPAGAAAAILPFLARH